MERPLLLDRRNTGAQRAGERGVRRERTGESGEGGGGGGHPRTLSFTEALPSRR